MKRETAQRHSLKIMAIFFAVSLWFYVLNSEPIQIEKKLSINYIIPKGFSIASKNEKELTIKIKGSKAFIQNIFTNKEKFNVDLNPYFESSGKSFKVKFFTSEIKVPFGVDVLEISPNETTIELDRNVLMKIPIKVLYIGEAPRNRKINYVLVEPKHLMISGPLSLLKSISNIESVPVNLALFNSEEGSTTVSIIGLDSRFKFEDSQTIKIKYKTELLRSKK